MLRQVRWLHNNRSRMVVASSGAHRTLASGGVQGTGHALRPGLVDIHAWLNDPVQRPIALELLAEVSGARLDLTRLDQREIASLLERGFARGELRARRMRLPAPHIARPEEKEAEPTPTAEHKEKHVLDFVVEYPDGEAVSGAAWELVHPSGKRETGTLGQDGIVHRDGVAPGNYQLVLKEVERAVWRDPDATPGKASTLLARVCGFPNGTSAKVRLFRELAETDDDVVATLQGTVKDDAVEMEIEVDPKKHGGGRPGELRLVAEVSIEGGKYWAKTSRPLSVAPRAIVHTMWTCDPIGGISGAKETALRVRATGFADGTKVRADLVRSSPELGEEALATVEAALDGGVATFPFSLDEDPMAEAPALEGDRLRRWGEYRALVRIGDDPEIVAKTPLLAVEPTDPDLDELRKAR